jgi:WD40 repeat protein/serine/threonine protein kinase
MSACPSPDVLEGFLGGRLPAAGVRAIDAHVEHCLACQRILEELTPALVAAARSSQPLGAPIDPSTLERLKEERPALVRDRRTESPRMGSFAPLSLGGDVDLTRGAGIEASLRAVALFPAIEGFEIVREVGRGGMGIVYEAIELALGRRVALKVLPPMAVGPTAAERFRREARAAGQLHHTSIVPIFGVGEASGLLYYAMQFIEGQGLDRLIGQIRMDRAAANKGHDKIGADLRRGAPANHATAGSAPTLTFEEHTVLAPSSGAVISGHARTVARIGAQVADALEYAHRHGFLHRDIKPSNILVTSAGAAWVTDFGLAKSAEIEEGLTRTGDVVGTIRYMPPERFDGRSDARGDVYSLGVTLYELLALRPAYADSDRTRLIERVLETEPVALHRIEPRVPRDLETIILKAMAKEPARRYATAGQLADDLRRFLDGQPVLARPPGIRGRLARWARRRPDLAGLAASLAAVTVLAFAVITLLWFAAAAARDRAQMAVAEVTRREHTERRSRYQAAIAAAAAALELNDIDAARAMLESAPEEHRDWEWRYFNTQLDNARIVFRPSEGSVSTLALAPEGDRIAYVLAGGRDVRLRRLGAASDLLALRGHEAEVSSIVFSHDGSLLAAGSGDRTVRVWEVPTGRAVTILPGLGDRPAQLLFSSDGKRLITIDQSGVARVWCVADGRHLARFSATAVDISPDGRRVVALEAATFRATLRDADTGAEIAALSPPGKGSRSAVFSPDGKRVAVGLDYPDNRVLLCDVSARRQPVVLVGHKNAVRWLAFSRDGRTLASTSLDQTVRLWDVSSGKAKGVLRGYATRVDCGAFSESGGQLVTVGWDKSARVWDTSDGELLGIFRCRARNIGQAGLSRSASVVAMLEEGGVVRVWDVDLATRRGVVRGHKSYVYDVAFAPDGRTIASAAWDSTIRIWDSNQGTETFPLRHPEPIVTTVALSPDGRRAASVARNGHVRLWDLEARREAWSFDLSARITKPLVECRVAFSPREDLLAATGSEGGPVWLYDTVTRKPLQTLTGHEIDASDASFSPDGSRLASSDWSGMLRLWDVARRAPLAAVKAHDTNIHRISFSPNGQVLATASADQTVRLWDAVTLRCLAALKHGGQVYGIAFSPSGTRLAAACGDRTVRLWDLVTHEEVAVLRGHGDFVHAVAFSTDGTRLVSCSGDYTIRVWDSLPPSKRDFSEDPSVHVPDRNGQARRSESAGTGGPE